MRPRYYLHMLDDNLSGLYGHRSSELINRPVVVHRIVRPTKAAQQVIGRRATGVRLGRAFVSKLTALGIK